MHFLAITIITQRYKFVSKDERKSGEDMSPVKEILVD